MRDAGKVPEALPGTWQVLLGLSGPHQGCDASTRPPPSGGTFFSFSQTSPRGLVVALLPILCHSPKPRVGVCPSPSPGVLIQWLSPTGRESPLQLFRHFLRP